MKAADSSPVRAIVSIAALVLLGTHVPAEAQLPVCAPPNPEEPVYFACLERGRVAVVPVLGSLSVDQLISNGGAAITRDPGKVLRSVIGAEALAVNETMRDYIARLPELALTRIDSSTGTFRMDIGDEERAFKGDVVVGEMTSRLALELPRRIEGGYWRTAGSLHMAFWKGQRVSFSAEAGGARIAGEAECLVVSADGVRLITSGTESPDILIGFGPCP